MRRDVRSSGQTSILPPRARRRKTGQTRKFVVSRPPVRLDHGIHMNQRRDAMIKPITILQYEADGLNFRSELYVDDQGDYPRPGILVFPEAFGLGEHARSKAIRLAELGYSALACDLHGDGHLERDLDAAIGLINPLREDPYRTRARADAAFAALAARPEVDARRMAAIGYCFGGTMALELGRSGADLKVIAGFHSGLGTSLADEAGNIKGRVMVAIGADDPAIPPAQRLAFEEEMRRGSVDWHMQLYGGVVHSFTNPRAADLNRPEFARYDEFADEDSFSAMLDVFDQAFA
jgi:dienelactone hydrolase